MRTSFFQYIRYPGAGIPPDSEDWTWHEQTMQTPWIEEPNQMVRKVVIPTLTMFKSSSYKTNNTAVINLPCGAFHFLMMNHDGFDVARWLTKYGVTSFVPKYRVQHMPEEDATIPVSLENCLQNYLQSCRQK